MRPYTRIVTIAGSDSGGGAGIQADLKTISACGCFGMSVITAVTAQNTCGVSALHPVPVPVVEAQINAVLEDIGADGIKIGMLYAKETAECVGRLLPRFGCGPIILDPVLTATSGDALAREDLTAAMKDALFPVVRLLTPNIPEAEHLLGSSIGGDLADAARQMAQEFAVSVLLKAGHRPDEELVDVLYDYGAGTMTAFGHPRVDTVNTHGTGCTLSSAIAAFAAKGLRLQDAVTMAEEYVHAAIRAGAGLRLGHGHGPVHHFHEFWQ